MRRALLPWLPAFSARFGIQPWQIDQLTYREIERYIRTLNEIAAAQQQANRR
jgi:hypothetical protein